MDVQLVSFLTACLLSTVHSEGSVDFCYNLPSCNASTWPTLSPHQCNGARQSPINIVTADVRPDNNLTAFTFTGFGDNSTLLNIINTGKTVKIELDGQKISVSGGGLQNQYNSSQIHFHWGNGSSTTGSEHTVDGRQYAMEMHIVNVRADLSSATALNDSTGYAVLGFFIEATSDSGTPESWKNLTSYLSKIPNEDESTWPSIPSAYCSGSHQSPINIVTTNVEADVNLTSFSFTGFDDGTVMTEMTNTGRGVMVTLNHEKMMIEAGALPGIYHSTQFHFHWGNGSSMPGSEHMINGQRFSMEMHLVNVKEGSNSTVDDTDPTGFAVLGFFLKATNDAGKPESWRTLTSYLSSISDAGDKVAITQPITMDSLLEGVDQTKYYRYVGSLTTPPCSEAVVWTIFKDPIEVSQDL
ncbi:carbonic anhydrase 4-like, partial [Clarias magur]